jgi:DNA-binding NarL/FixJ family response regulator
MTDAIRVLVVDSQAIVRQGIRTILSGCPEVTVVGEAGDGGSAIDLVAQLRPDVVLLDLRLRGESGLDLCRQLVRHHPLIAVVVLTSEEQEQHMLAALRAGARGYLLKQLSGEDLLEALRAVRRGEVVLDPTLGGRLALRVAQAPNGSRRGGADPFRLSPREYEVLAHLSDGRSNREIAAELCIGEETVRSHVKGILRKLRVNDRSHAIVVALRTGLVE